MFAGSIWTYRLDNWRSDYASRNNAAIQVIIDVIDITIESDTAYKIVIMTIVNWTKPHMSLINLEIKFDSWFGWSIEDLSFHETIISKI